MMFDWPRHCALALLLVPAAVIGQSRLEGPTFRSGVQSIDVDVLVTDKSGNTVRGLTKEDFTLIEDDTPQQISTFTFVDLPIIPPATRKASVSDVEPDVVTNTGKGRMYVIVLTRANQRVRLVARRFVEESVGPDDQVAVIQLCGTMSAAQAFTSNRHLMLAAIDRILIGTGGDDVRSVQCDKVVQFQIIEEMAERLSLVTARRKVVAWFDPPSVFHGGGPNPAAERFAQRDAVRALTRSNTALYVVSSQGLAFGNLEYKAGLQVLADDTGGDIIVDSNNFSGAFERFVHDNSSYYLLGYVPVVEHRDGKFHNLRVRVNRPGLTVRARRGYYAPEADEKPKPTPPVADGLSAETAAAIRMPSSQGELGIELSLAPFKSMSGRGSVVLNAQLRGADLVLEPREPIEIAFQATTTEGKITPGTFKVLTLDFTPESQRNILRAGIRVLDRIELPRGRHQVRFAVHQPNGKTGTVVADVEIPDYSAPLLMSGVILASQQTAAHHTLLSDPRLTSILGSDPTSVRRFGRRDVVTAFAEIYFNAVQSDGVRVTASVATASGKKAGTVEPSVLPGDESGRMGYVAQVPLANLNAGDYVLTFEARTARAAARRQVPFTVLSD
jgi:VWFA-related protein